MSLSLVNPSLYLMHAHKDMAWLDGQVTNSRRCILFAFTFSPPL
ncbi:hypothetical protein [Pseudomonas cichorii]|nr:hypothetical protein [Pseudomonas cichorii]